MHTLIVHIFKYTISNICHALKTVHPEDVYSKMHTEKCILKKCILKNVYLKMYTF